MKRDTKDENKDVPDALSYLPFPQFRFGSRTDVALTLIGLLCAMLSGLCVPGIIVLYGDLAEVFVQYQISTVADGTNVSREHPVGYRRIGRSGVATPELAEETTNFAIFSAILAVAQLIFTSAFVACLNKAALGQSVRAREAHFESLLLRSLSWFDSQDCEELASKSIRDVNYLQAGLGEKLGMFVSSTVAACACTVVALYYGSKLAGTLLTVVPFVALIIYAAKQMNDFMKKREDLHYEPAEAIVEDSLLNIRSVSAYSGESHECEKYLKRLVAAENCEITRGVLGGVVGAVLWALLYSTYALAFWYGVELLRSDESYTVATLIVVFFCIQIGVLQTFQLPQYLHVIAKSNAATRKMIKMIEAVPTIEVSTMIADEAKSEHSIAFDNVTFGYPSGAGDALLKRASFDISGGHSIALVGRPDSGKTTCMALIHRFYDPQEGTILLDGANAKDLNPTWLRKHVGFAQQCPVLFGASLKECITCYATRTGETSIESIAKIVGIHSFIVGLPQKYDTPLTTDLPVDKKQRLALARILYREPRVLLMDNALSALSSRAEEAIYDAIKVAYRDITILMVTDNPRLLRRMNSLLYLRDGVVEEFSTVDDMQRAYPETKKLTRDKEEETRDEMNLETFAKCKTDARNAKTILPYTPSFLGRSYQELFRTELVRVGRHPVFFQVTDIPSEDDVSREDLASANTAKLLYYNRKEWLQLLLAGVAASILGLSLPIYAVLFGETLSLVALHSGIELQARLNFFAGMFLLAGFVSGMCTVVQSYMVSVAGGKLTTRLRRLAFERILRQDMEWFDCDANGSCKVRALLRVDAQRIQRACGQSLIHTVQAITSLTVSVVLSMIYNWKLGLATLAFTPLTLLALHCNNRLLLRESFSVSRDLNKAKEIVREAVVNIRSVLALTLEDHFARLYRDEIERIAANHRGFALQALVHGSCVALPSMAYSAAMFYGGHMLRNGEIEVGRVLKVAEAIILGTLVAGHLVSLAPNVAKARTSAVKLFKVIESSSSSRANKRGKGTIEIGSIAFADTSFRHPRDCGAAPQLLHFDARINRGETVALVGPSHSAASIPIQLLLSFHEPTSGEILLNGERSSVFNASSVKRQFALVDGEPIFFQRSVADNIAYGNLGKRVGMDEIVTASKAALCHDFVTALDNGYETILHRSQINLTRSQKMRLSLARALIRNPSVLLLDNVQRAESDEAEMTLRRAILSASADRICIASTRDPFSSTQIFSRLIVIDRGHATESGTHEELINAGGHYAKLYRDADEGDVESTVEEGTKAFRFRDESDDD